MTRPKSGFPHPLSLLVGCVIVAALLTWVLPAGQYDRRDDPATGRRVVVGGTYHAVTPQPVGPFEAVVAIPKGMGEAAGVIFFVFLVGGAFTVVDRTGALSGAVSWLVGRLGDRRALAVPAVSVVFAVGGALEHTKEEVIALVPLLLLLTSRLGYDAVTAVAMSLGAAFVGAAFSPLDPFQVGIAQQLAELSPLSGSAFRMAFLLPAVATWIWMTMRHAARSQTAPVADSGSAETLGARQTAVLALFAGSFGVFIYGVMRHHWGFEEMAALFFVMGVVAGPAGGLGVHGTARAYVEGFTSMAYAGVLIGFARAIYVVLDQGRVVDTLIHGLFTPLAGLPVALSALGMMAAHTAVHVPVPSPSGQAVLTMPVLVPLSDLIGLSRQVTVLSYQLGCGLAELLTPTSGALMAVLAAAGVPWDRWIRFAAPAWLLLFALSGGAVITAVAVGLK